MSLPQHPLAPVMANGAILLDKDGVLVDFHRTWKPAIKRAALAVARLAAGQASPAPAGNAATAADGIDALAARLLRAVGHDAARDTFLPGSIWAAGTQEELFDTWAAALPALPRWRIAETVSAVLRETKPQPVVPPRILRPLLREARRNGCRLAIVTNDLTESALATARQQGLDDLLDAVIGADLCQRPKPHPDLVWRAAEELGVPPRHMLMVGDNVHDGEMARRGGCAGFIGVLSGTSGREELEPLANVVVADVADALRWALRTCGAARLASG